MTLARRPRAYDIRFRAAAGPRRGYGHLMRCLALADALGIEPRVSLRASGDPAGASRRFGFEIWNGCLDGDDRDRPDLLVVDDPSAPETSRWVRSARSAGIPVVTIHDFGLGIGGADLAVDGSAGLAPVPDPARLSGLGFAILHPEIAQLRRRRLVRRRDTVLVTLGGGVHVRRHGVALALEIQRRSPRTRVLIAPGFGPPPLACPLPPGCGWLRDPRRLRASLRRVGVAVVAGGVTVYEACALGAPSVALAVVPGQRATIRHLATAGAVRDAGTAGKGRAIARAAAAVVELLQFPEEAAALGRRARRLVDGRGAFRVARAIEQLWALQRSSSRRRRPVQEGLHAA